MSNGLQNARRRRAITANLLSKESMINSAFERADDEVLTDIFKFLAGYVSVEDLRFDKEKLLPEKIRERIRKNLSDENINRWVDFSAVRTPTQHFLADMLEVNRCIGGLKLATSLIRQNLVRDFFLRYLSLEVQGMSISPKQSATDLTRVLSGSEEDPSVAARVVYEFIGAIRDAGNEKQVLLGFFEGFSVEIGVLKVSPVKWASAPMLHALANADKTRFVRLYNDFINMYLAEKMNPDRLGAGDWQRRYDQQFQMLINLQSGMFNPGVTYSYGESQKE